MISKAKTKLIRSLELKKNRKALGLFVAEGPKVVNDLMAVYTPVFLVGTLQWIQATTNIPEGIEVCEVTEEELRKISFLQHPQQVLAIFHIPEQQNIPITHTLGDGGRLLLALDGIQDPGNLGTIIRIADWFGIEDIFCSLDTADVWNPKVVQATMGSIARVHIHYCNLHTLLDALSADFPVYGTLLDGDDINKAEICNNGLIIMGNEGNGISPEIASRVTHRLLIPNYPAGRPTADSLNVAIATAITCFAIRQKAFI